MKIAVPILSVLIVISCSVYNRPMYIQPGEQDIIEVYEYESGKKLRSISDKDSVSKAIDLFNMNEGYNGPIKEGYLINIIAVSENETDTSKFILSANGMYFIAKDLIRKNPYGKVLSKKDELFHLSKNIKDFLVGN